MLLSVFRKWLGLSHSPLGLCPLPICTLTTSAPLCWLIIILARAPSDRRLHHGVPRPDLPIQSRIDWCPCCATGPFVYSPATSPRLASTGTDVSWTHALRYDDSSPLLASRWSTSSTTIDLFVLITPNLDTHGTTLNISTYTTDLFTNTSGSHKSYAPTTQPHTEIADVYGITFGKLSDSRRLHLPPNRNSTGGTMET